MTFFDFLLQDFWSFFSVFLEAICLILKVFILGVLYAKVPINGRNKTLLYFSIILLTGIFTNIALILCRLGDAPFNFFPPAFFRSFLRAENATLAIQVYSMLLFSTVFTSLKKPKSQGIVLNFFKVFTVLSTVFFVYRGVYTLISGDISQLNFMKKAYPIWGIILVIEGFFAVFNMYKNYVKERINLLRYHISTLGFFYMFPYFLMKVFEIDLFAPVNYFPTTTLKVNFPMTTLTSVWLTVITYYCARRLMKVRFLNIQNHVATKSLKNINFVNDFKEVLDKLGAATTFVGIHPIVRDFFYKAFNVKEGHAALIIRDSLLSKNKTFVDLSEEQDLQQSFFIDQALWLNPDYKELTAFLNREKIVIRDEIEFTHFYNQQAGSGENLESAIDFLKALNAEVYIPVYCDNKLIASVIITNGGRPNRFYSDIERDEMMIFAGYLGNILYLLGFVSIEFTLQRQRALEKEVYKKTKMLSMFRKSIYTIIHARTCSKHIGVLTYRNRKFTHCNQASRDVLQVDLNRDRGSDVTRAVVDIAQNVALFHLPKRAIVTNSFNEQIALSVTPNLEKNTTILTVSNPNLIDYIEEEIALLYNESKWNYLLALKTTEEGRSVNYLLPADTSILLNAKVTLLEHATTQKTILLEILSSEDTTAFVYVINKINNKKIIEEYSISEKTDEALLLKTLFGVAQFADKPSPKGMLERLHKKGTLFIRNVHLLSLDMQRQLLNFIKTGKYVPLHSDEYKDADVLVICSSDQNLNEMVDNGLFLQELLTELRKGALMLPLIASLPEAEFNALLEGLRRQLIYSKVYENLLVLSEGDRKKLYESGCTSLVQLKIKIQNILVKKTRKKALNDDTIIDPGAVISDLDLAKAARLGKTVLKDPKMLALLMRKFNNSQSKVANFLGVNRSTVNRRCSKYNIMSDVD